MRIPIRTVCTEDFSMEYFKFGEGEKTFVILPGISVKSVTASADAVAKQYADMNAEYTTYVFDRRKDLPAVYSIRDMARDTAAAVRELGLTDIHLFGASQGGMMAMVIAAEHPELVRALVLGSASARVSDDQFTELEKWLALAEKGDGGALYLAFGRAIYPEKTFRQFEKLLAMFGKAVTKEELERFTILAEGAKGFDALADLARIRCPVLVIGSEDDQVLGADASLAIIKKLGEGNGCEWFLYEGYGHAAFDTAPDYRQRLLAFFRKIS